jgi:hypothetical protein
MKIADGSGISISPCKTKLAYTYRPINSDPANLFRGGVHVFNIHTKKDILLKHYDRLPVCGATWSPNGNFLVIDIGTEPTRGKIIIDSSTGQEIIGFDTAGHSGDNFSWINNDTIVYNVLPELT